MCQSLLPRIKKLNPSNSSSTTEYTISDMTWKCNFDGTSTYALSSTRTGKVNMLPTMTTADQYMISGLAAVVGITFDTTLNYNLMDTITIEVNEIQTGKFNYR